jgi:hypothetical protein
MRIKWRSSNHFCSGFEMLLKLQPYSNLIALKIEVIFIHAIFFGTSSMWRANQQSPLTNKLDTWKDWRLYTYTHTYVYMVPTTDRQTYKKEKSKTNFKSTEDPVWGFIDLNPTLNDDVSFPLLDYLLAIRFGSCFFIYCSGFMLNMVNNGRIHTLT